ncbi:MAG: hypothetical protein ABSA78_15370 [Candidatus Sulfotelmatobacter sp.]
MVDICLIFGLNYAEMASHDYRTALDAAVAELEDLLMTQEVLRGRILSLRKTVYALSTLCQEAGEKLEWRERSSARLKEVLESSITDDILNVVYGSAVPLTTTGVRNELEKIGTLERHKNPLATINAVLTRLVQQGKLMETKTTSGRKAWEKSTTPVSKVEQRSKRHTSKNQKKLAS